MLASHDLCTRGICSFRGCSLGQVACGKPFLQRCGLLVAPHGCRSAGIADAAPHAELLVEECNLNNWRSPLSSLIGSTAAGEGRAVVALGKFDALHRGHRSLVEQAGQMAGTPWLISFSGMAAELGWQERLPLVASSERPAILRGWADHCGGVAPRMRCIPFAAVRQLSPRDFVAALAEDMRAAGVVIGSNYRFGFKAAGTAETLVELGADVGMAVRVMDLLGDESNADDKVSSSEVRRALERGQLDQVAHWLGRPYSLIAHLPDTSPSPAGGQVLRLLQQAFMNQPPGTGSYEATVSSAGEAADGRSSSSGQPNAECRVGVEMTKLGQAAVMPLAGGEWPPWASDLRKLCLTFQFESGQ